MFVVNFSSACTLYCFTLQICTVYRLNMYCFTLQICTVLSFKFKYVLFTPPPNMYCFTHPNMKCFTLWRNIAPDLPGHHDKLRGRQLNVRRRERKYLGVPKSSRGLQKAVRVRQIKEATFFVCFVWRQYKFCSGPKTSAGGGRQMVTLRHWFLQIGTVLSFKYVLFYPSNMYCFILQISFKYVLF